MSPEQKTVARYFQKRPALYIGGLGTIFGIQAGILLSQLLYWSSKGKRKDGFIYKTEKELTLELGLTRNQQETAIRRLTELGIIEYKLAQVPAKKHFRVNMQRLQDVLPSLKDFNKLSYPNPPSRNAGNAQSITETTRKTTSQNTKQSLNRDTFMRERRKLISDKSVTSGRRKSF